MSNASPIATAAYLSISRAGTQSTQPAPQYQTEDPILQAAFETVWSLFEFFQKHSHYRCRREELKRELAIQQRYIQKQTENEEDFPGLQDYQNFFNSSLNKDLEDLNKKVSESDKQFCHEFERVAAFLFKKSTTGSPQQTPPIITKDSPSSNLENELAEFKKQVSSQQKQILEQSQKIRTLEDEKKKSFFAQQERTTKLAQKVQPSLGKNRLSTQQNQVTKQAQLVQATASAPSPTSQSQLTAPFMEYVNRLFELQENQIGGIIDDLTARVNSLETNEKDLEGRIKCIDDQKFHEKYTRLVDPGTRVQGDFRKAGIDQIKERTEVIELCSNNLDSKWSNIQPKGMIQLIFGRSRSIRSEARGYDRKTRSG